MEKFVTFCLRTIVINREAVKNQEDWYMSKKSSEKLSDQHRISDVIQLSDFNFTQQIQ